MEKSILDILFNLLTGDATSSVIILFLIIIFWIIWRFVISPIRSDIKDVGVDVKGFFNNNKTQQMKDDIAEIKDKQKVQNDMVKDLDYIVDFIKSNTGLIDLLKEVSRNTSDVILTKDNLNSINQDLIYIKKYIDNNFDNYKKLTEISNDIKVVVKYIENNKANIDSKYLENALAVILEGIGHQTRTKFER